jgi:3-oxoacyl-[acyl-carrier-protein] synthase III
MASVLGNAVLVTTQEQYDALVVMPNSISGWFNPATSEGRVIFGSVASAQYARRFV